MEDTFTVTKEIEVRRGFGAWFMPVWSGEEDYPETIVEVDGGVIEISPETVRDHAGTLCAVEDMPHGGAFGIPVDNFVERDDLAADDTHDLRERLFATREEAEQHVAYTLERFQNPAPWCSFVQL